MISYIPYSLYIPYYIYNNPPILNIVDMGRLLPFRRILCRESCMVFKKSGLSLRNIHLTLRNILVSLRDRIFLLSFRKVPAEGTIMP